MATPPNKSQKQRAISIAASVVLLLIAAAFMFRPEETKLVEEVYFYDLGSQALYTDSSKLMPPVEAPSGDKGVWVYVFSCGDCSDESARQVGYLLTHSDEYKNALAVGGDDVPLHLASEGTFVRAADGSQWLRKGSLEGTKIVSDAQSPCSDGTPPTTCTP